jgi:NADH-quinone oxidoreductase subunit L
MSPLLNHLWIIPFFPLLGFLINLAFGSRMQRRTIAVVGCGVVALSFLAALGCFLELLGRAADERAAGNLLYTWIHVGSLKVQAALLLDPLSATMTLVVTGVGLLIHVYSVGYMADEPKLARYFAYLNLFTCAMLILVLADNYVLMFVGWEGVGLCSYLLIGFWFEKTPNADAGKKAFVVNRVGDAGFILGMLLLAVVIGAPETAAERFSRMSPALTPAQANVLAETIAESGPLSFAAVNRAVPHLVKGNVPARTAGADLALEATPLAGVSGKTIAVVAALLLFIGACGKSAQIPLYVWLPDAMAGPTPVSALIHAATMVTAGVYMIARSHVLYDMAPFAGGVVATVGALTALLAASIALVQNDIKKVLAYSTISQLGFMFLAVGTGAYAAGVFHLVTHAFFKALLFLGAGAVIHMMHHALHQTHDHRSDPNDIRLMGGLRHVAPVTGATFLIGSLAIAGVPPLAGFFSKDEILAMTAVHGGAYWILWLIGSVTAALTAFYTGRLYLLVFEGQNRLPAEQRRHLHPSPPVMAGPLIVLAVLAAFGGLLGVPHFLDFVHVGNLMHSWLEPALHTPGIEPAAASATMEGILAAVAVLIAAGGLLLSWRLYVVEPQRPKALRERFAALYGYLSNKWFVDEIYEAFVVQPVKKLGEQLWTFLDVKVIDGAVNGLASTVGESSQDFRRAQTGNVQIYLFVLCGGALFVLFYLLLTTS